MGKTGRKSDDSNSSLKAEDLIKNLSAKDVSKLSESETTKLLHVLVNHQVELEQQNKELLLAQENFKIENQKYVEFYDFAPFGYYKLSKEGEILDVNLSGAKFLSKNQLDLQNSKFGFFVSDATKPIYNQFLNKVFNSKVKQTCEVVIITNTDSQINVLIDGITSKDGEQCYLTLIDITDRKLADEKLLESEEFFTLFMNYLPALVFIKDDKGRALFANKAMDIALGASAWMGLKAEEIFDKETAERINADDKKTIQVGYEKFEESFSNLDGKIHHYETQKFSIPKSNSYYLGGIAFDITDRKQAEENLLAEQAFRNAVEFSLGSGIAIVDKDGKQIYVNPAFCRMVGWTEEELIDRTAPFVYWPTEQLQAIGAAFQATVSNNAPVEGFELVFMRKDNVRFPAQVIISPFSDGRKIKGWLANVIDITERKHAEEALKVSESNLQALVNNRNESIWSLDKNYNLIFCNEYFRNEFFAVYNIELVEGISLLNILPAELRLFWQQKYDEVFFGKKISFEFSEMIRGIRCFFAVFLNPIVIDEKVIGASVISIDITDRKKTEEEIIKANSELKKLNSEKDKLFSIIAHDLKSPFNGLLGITEAMVTNNKEYSSSEIVEYTGVLYNSVINVYKLLENLLEWAQLQKGSIGFTPEEIRLSEAFLESKESIKQSAEHKQITINNEIPEVIKTYADEKMVNSLLRNLLTNAIKFTNKGGKIAAKAREVEDGMIEVSISDTGIGIPAEIIPKLFVVGEKIGSRGTEDEPSTGLGLVLCKEFVEKHGGKIWVESEENLGSTFYFSLPSKNENNVL